MSFFALFLRTVRFFGTGGFFFETFFFSGFFLLTVLFFTAIFRAALSAERRASFRASGRSPDLPRADPPGISWAPTRFTAVPLP